MDKERENKLENDMESGYIWDFRGRNYQNCGSRLNPKPYSLNPKPSYSFGTAQLTLTSNNVGSFLGS